MFSTIAASVRADADYAPRTRKLDLMTRVLMGTIYDNLPYDFHQERANNGEYIPLAQRKPSVRSNVIRVAVEDSLAVLFGEGRFPLPDTPNASIRDGLVEVIKQCGLNALMSEAALRGSVGSVCLFMRVLKGRLYFSALETPYLTPEYDPEAPDTLIRVVERYKLSGRDLVAHGYDVDPMQLQETFWFRREFGTDAEIWFLPQTLSDASEGIAPQIDAARSVQHKLGFVPMVWIKNLPGGTGVDGACTFAAAVETQIEIDYQLSQAGRGLKYSADPTLVLLEGAGSSAPPRLEKGANALVLGEGGDAKLLEINGTAAAAQIEFAKSLREIALEAIHGNRSPADKAGAAQSGRAIELLYQPLVWLADRLRTSYGQQGLVSLLRLVMRARSRIAIELPDGTPLPDMPERGPLGLIWPPFFPETATDNATAASAIATLRSAGVLSQATAIQDRAGNYDIEDVAAEQAAIAADQAAQDARMAAQAAQVRANEDVD